MKFSILLASSMFLLTTLFASPAAAESLLVGDPDPFVDAEHTFRQLGQTIMGRPLEGAAAGQHVEFGSIVRLSKDGNRMAVSAPQNKDHDGEVFVYERDEATVDEDVAQSTWRVIFELKGTTEDSAGGNLALSDDGNVLAIRRGSEVEVYRYNVDTQTYALMGNRPTEASGSCNGGKGLTLGQTSTGTAYFLLISCESFEKSQGKVDVLTFDQVNNLWKSLATVAAPEPTPGDRFGWETAVLVRDSQQDVITVAVSSPNNDKKTGLVQVFRVFTSKGRSSQMGDDLKGQAQGDQFGFSLDMSTLGHPRLVVGAPLCSSNKVARAGCVSVYHWSSGADGFAWKAIGSEPFYGLQEDDRLGRAVAITHDGGRFGATSFRYNRQQGQVRLFEQDIITATYEPIGDIVGQEPLSRWGQSIAMNEFGSMIASGSVRSKTEAGDSVGSVQVFLDETPFCSQPSGNDATINDLFLTRNVCHSAINRPFECTAVKCVWVEALPKTSEPSDSPSMVPSISPSDGPSDAPSDAPTEAPSFISTPTTAPSQVLILLEDWHDEVSDDEADNETSTLRKDGNKQTVQWAIIGAIGSVFVAAGALVVKKYGLKSSGDDGDEEVEEDITSPV